MQSKLTTVLALRDSLEDPNPDLSHFCFVPPGETASDYAGEVYLGNYACGIRGADLPVAYSFCYRLAGTLGFCTGTCEGPNNTFLNCGEGYRCGQPELDDSIFAPTQLDTDGKTVTCTGPGDSTSCDTAGGYGCGDDQNGGFYCAKPTFVCIKD
ncbi:MAG: hypothetical protein H7Z43_02545 [Clostridia bacterium]|nr:hypothetical protein [Deltaproteobacteria bacterium]